MNDCLNNDAERFYLKEIGETLPDSMADFLNEYIGRLLAALATTPAPAAAPEAGGMGEAGRIVAQQRQYIEALRKEADGLTAALSENEFEPPLLSRLHGMLLRYDMLVTALHATPTPAPGPGAAVEAGEALLRDETDTSFKLEFQEGDSAWYVYTRHTSAKRAVNHLASLIKEPHFSNREWRIVRHKQTNQEQLLPAPLTTGAAAAAPAAGGAS